LNLTKGWHQDLLHKEVRSKQKQPSCKNGVALKAWVKKSEIKGGG